MSETTMFLLDIVDSNSLYGPVWGPKLHRDNLISNLVVLARVYSWNVTRLETGY
jgi:hypothetical protein